MASRQSFLTILLEAYRISPVGGAVYLRCLAFASFLRKRLRLAVSNLQLADALIHQRFETFESECAEACPSACSGSLRSPLPAAISQWISSRGFGMRDGGRYPRF